MKGGEKFKSKREKIDDGRRLFTSAGLAAAIEAFLLASPTHAATPQASSWKKAPEAVGAIPRDSFFKFLQPKFASAARALDTIQAKLRDPRFRRMQADTTYAGEVLEETITKHPDCRFDMLTREVRERVREYFDKRMVSIYRKSEKHPIEIRAVGKINPESNMFIDVVYEPHGMFRGNGFVVRRGEDYYVLTNMHNIFLADHREGNRSAAQALYPNVTADAAFYKVSTKDLEVAGIDPRDAIDIDTPLPKGFKIDGAPVVCRGFDTDKFDPAPPLNRGGFKEWFAIARRMNPILWSRLHVDPKPTGHKRHLALAGHVFKIPKEEAVFRNDLHPTALVRLAEGMSGSGVVALYEDEQGQLQIVFVGVQFAAYATAAGAVEYADSAFHYIDYIRESLNNPFSVFALKSTPAVRPKP